MRTLLLAGLLACPSVPNPAPVPHLGAVAFSVGRASGHGMAPDTLILKADWTNPQVPVDSVRLVLFGIQRDTTFVFRGSLPLNPTSITWQHTIPTTAYPSAGVATYTASASWFVFRGSDIYPTHSPGLQVALGPLALPPAPVTGINLTVTKRP